MGPGQERTPGSAADTHLQSDTLTTALHGPALCFTNKDRFQIEIGAPASSRIVELAFDV